MVQVSDWHINSAVQATSGCHRTVESQTSGANREAEKRRKTFSTRQGKLQVVFAHAVRVGLVGVGRLYCRP